LTYSTQLKNRPRKLNAAPRILPVQGGETRASRPRFSSAHLLGALAQLAEQPRVLHRDDRLRREILQDLNLLLSKRFHLLAENRDRGAKLPPLITG
jgi:hypothetical protein